MRIIGNRGNTARKVQAVASGALASGDTVVVNADGTVSVVEAATQALGSNQIADVGNYVSAAFDTANNRLVIAYTDSENSNYGTAIVGTISGTSISYGTPVVFRSSDSEGEINAVFDSSANKVVIIFKDAGDGNKGKAVVGTVNSSNNSISFGSVAVFRDSNIQDFGLTFDSNSNRVVISYQDTSGKGTAIVGRVSGTNISFGSAVIFNTATGTRPTGITFDSNSNKVVIAYRDASFNANGPGSAIVGTVSGTSISFGSEAEFESSNVRYISATFDTLNNKVIIGYTILNSGSDHQGAIRSIVGTVSNTSISFGSANTVDSGGDNRFTSIGFDPSGGKFIIAYRDDDPGKLAIGTVSGTNNSTTTPETYNSGTQNNWKRIVYSPEEKVSIIAGASIVSSSYKVAGTVYRFASTNLTSENYIGIASNGYATGQAATINAKGFIDDNQSSLTAGQSYFVQTNGDLGLTAADPSVFAGTAVSATKLIVKG